MENLNAKYYFQTDSLTIEMYSDIKSLIYIIIYICICYYQGTKIYFLKIISYSYSLPSRKSNKLLVTDFENYVTVIVT